jgi:hypothetical protein
VAHGDVGLDLLPRCGIPEFFLPAQRLRRHLYEEGHRQQGDQLCTDVAGTVQRVTLVSLTSAPVLAVKPPVPLRVKWPR